MAYYDGIGDSVAETEAQTAAAFTSAMSAAASAQTQAHDFIVESGPESLAGHTVGPVEMPPDVTWLGQYAGGGSGG